MQKTDLVKEKLPNGWRVRVEIAGEVRVRDFRYKRDAEEEFMLLHGLEAGKLLSATAKYKRME